jgi:hypothetical protein
MKVFKASQVLLETEDKVIMTDSSRKNAYKKAMSEAENALRVQGAIQEKIKEVERDYDKVYTASDVLDMLAEFDIRGAIL